MQKSPHKHSIQHKSTGNTPVTGITQNVRNAISNNFDIDPLAQAAVNDEKSNATKKNNKLNSSRWKKMKINNINISNIMKTIIKTLGILTILIFVFISGMIVEFKYNTFEKMFLMIGNYCISVAKQPKALKK